MSAPAGLARRSIGGGSLWAFAVGASSPMTVVAGSIVATYAATGVVGVPLSFLILAVPLALLTVGYVAMARHVAHAAPGYALLAHGLGRSAGVAGAAVALVGYNAIQICLYGLVGATLAGLAGGSWWFWAGVVWLLVALLGVRQVHLNALVLRLALAVEIAVIVLLDVAAFLHPLGGSVSLAPLAPDRLVVDGVGGVLALGSAAFVGYESGPVFAEEARGERVVARAPFATLAFLGVFYTVSAWAVAVAVGPDNVVDTARDPESGLPFSVLAGVYGEAVAWAATGLLVTSIVAAMLSFHNTVARYLFALGREKVVPAWLARVGHGSRSGAPVGGSVAQSATAAVVLLVFALANLDPITVLFTWLSTIGAVAILTLLVACSWAALHYFRAGGGTNEGVWTRQTAPALGVLAGLAVLAVMVGNVGSLLGVESGSLLTYAIPATVAIAGVLGLLWGGWLRRRRPAVHHGIGRGRPHPLAVLDHRLADLDV